MAHVSACGLEPRRHQVNSGYWPARAARRRLLGVQNVKTTNVQTNWRFKCALKCDSNGVVDELQRFPLRHQRVQNIGAKRALAGDSILGFM